jgi:hypothetical protein|tara:strand:+ start:12 stop:437 length:426 start_codon:yes stop_codon:yes gene_type:complete
MQMSEATEPKIQLDQYVETYLAIRNQRATLKMEFEATDTALKSEMAKLEEVLLSECNNINADSIKTGSGTIIKTLRENFVCSDWDGLKEFIMEHSLIELMQQRLHNGNLKEYMITHGNEGLPPGINSIREYNIVVKKPTKS